MRLVPTRLCLLAAVTLGAGPVPADGVLAVASRLLDEAEISYVYGGYQVGDGEACKSCNLCLTENKPVPAKRLKTCPACSSCSLDCSHFTELVYREAGLPYPYLDTALMLGLSSEKLRGSYGLLDLGRELGRAAPGDLLVYDGHVVLLEKRHQLVQGQATYRGDIVHATGGKDIKTPGEGIQRERFIDLANFRGPLRRILRVAALAPTAPSLPKKSAEPRRKLRPVAKSTPND